MFLPRREAPAGSSVPPSLRSDRASWVTGLGTCQGQCLCPLCKRELRGEQRAPHTNTAPRPLTSRSLCSFRRLTSQSGSRSRSPRRLSNSRGSDSFSFSASCAGFAGGLGQRVREGNRGRKVSTRDGKKMGEDSVREKEEAPELTCKLDYKA